MASSTEFEPIAIVGMGMRLPGAVRDAESFWDLLSSGRSGHGPVPASRYNSEAWHSSRGRINHISTRHGYFLDDNDVNLARSVDLGFWSMGPQEAATLEPGARLLLEVVYEALETSGARARGGGGWRGSDTGVYVGTMGSDWTALEACDGQTQHPVRADVYGDYILANRTSYEFDFRGPSVVVRTACSSSLVALHQACQDLQRGVCSAAVVAGVNIILSPREAAVMSAQGVFSPSGKCQTFDADADGYGRGEGVSAVYVKRLSDALRDGDPVRSVIRSAVVGNDGHGSGKGMLAPDPAAHERLMRMAYRVAGISEEELCKTAMVECHGTGTAVGDPLETSAVANIWGDSGGIYIGSVKPNIGHGEGSSGISSIIKMTLALEHNIIPPNINFKKPNPAIPFESKKLIVPTKPMPWPNDRAERVSINCFGIGGTNAHVILESAVCAGVKTRPLHCDNDLTGSTKPSSRMRLLPFSTNRQDSLAKAVENINQYLEKHPTRLDDIAHTLSARRTMHPWRAFRVIGSGDSSAAVMPAACTIPPQRGKQKQAVCWVFTGQGAQWAQMGKQLIEQEPLVSRCIDHLDDVLRGLPEPPAWTIREEILKPKDTSRLYEGEISQPCLAAIQIAIVDLLRSWGSRPAAIVGHSSGETAAAYAADAITAEQAIALNYHRGQITPAVKAAHKGSMAAVGLSRAEVQPFLRPGVIIGCENSPTNVTLSGDAEVLRDIMNEIQAAKPDTLIRQLRVECGFHSAHMQTAVPDFTRRISEVAREAQKPVVPFYSSVSGDLHEDLAAPYWISNLVHPVLFNQAVQSLLRDFEDPVFVEIGPHAALAGPVRQILQKRFDSSSNKRSSAAPYVSTLVRGQDGHVNLLETAGRLWQYGAGDIDLDAVNNDGEGGKMVLTDLPAYPWHHDAAYWSESRLTREWRFRRFPHHELLGLRVIDCGDAAPAWRNVLRVSDVGWLADHRVAGDVWLPGAGFVAMVGEAIRQLAGKGEPSSGYSVREVVFENALVLADDDVVEIITSLVRIRQSGVGKLRQPGGGVAVRTSKTRYAFTISSIAEDGVATEHVYGECCAGRWEEEDSNSDFSTDTTATSSHDVSANAHHQQLQLPRQVSPAAFYKLWSKHGGLQYGPRFRGCMADVSAHVTEHRAMATITCVQQQPEDDEANDLLPEGADGIVDGDLYALHPTAIDTSTVLCMIAECCGLPRRFSSTGIPLSIGAMYVAAGDPGRQQQQTVRVEAQVFDDGTSGITGVDMNGRVVLEISGFQVDKTGQLGGKPGDDNPHGAAVIEWMPDVDFMDTKDLANVLQGKSTRSGQLLVQLATLCCKFLDRYQTNTVKQQRVLQEYKAWLDITISEYGEDNESDHAEYSDSDGFVEVEAADINLAAIQDLASKIHDECKGTPESALAATMLDTVLVSAGTVADSREYNPALPQRRRSSIIWDTIDEAALPRDLIDMLAFKTTRLRILDLCVGYDSARKEPPAYLKSLHEAGRLYGTYVHAYSEGGGISELSLAGEVVDVASRATTVKGIDFRSVRVDLDLDFTDQGLAAESFDLVMVTDLSGGGAHGLSSVDSTKLFANIRKLVDVDGSLVVRELQPESPLLQALQLRGAHDHVVQPEEPSAAVFVSAGNQGVSKQTLMATGFIHIASTSWPAVAGVPPGATRETSLCSSIIARPAPRDESLSSTVPALRVLFRDLHGESTRRALVRLRAEGFSDIEAVALGTPLAVGGRDRLALCLLDLDGPFLYSASEAEFEGLKQSLSLSLLPEAALKEQEQWQQIQNNGTGLETVTMAGTEKSGVNAGSNKDDCRGILWVTGASQMHCTSNPNYALTLGFTRGLHRETGDEIITLEVDSCDLSDDADDVGGYKNLDVGDNGSEKASNIARTSGRSTWGAVGDVLRSMDSRARSLQTRKHEYSRPLEREYVLSDGLVHISRFRETRLASELGERNAAESTHGEIVRSPSIEKSLEAVGKAGFKVFPDRTYVLVGGLGGLGQSTARLLADRGARHFMFFSRSAESFALQSPEFVAEMRGYAGCCVEFVSGDIASVRDVERMAAVLTSQCWPPLGGVLNAAMVLADGMLADMTHDQWQAAVKPKVEGTWNLHRVLFASRLCGGKGGGASTSSHSKVANKIQHVTDTDSKRHQHAPNVEVAPGAFLFLFSSLSGVAHMLGQANYAAANSFLDAFAQYHTHAVAPGYSAAAVLDIGAMADVGVLAREGNRLDRFRGQDWVRLLGEGEFLEAMEVVLGRQSCSAAPGTGAWEGGAVRRYVSPVQMVIGLGSPSNAKGVAAATATSISPPTTSHIGVSWNLDARFACHAVAFAAAAEAATATNNKNTTRDDQRQQGLDSTALDAQASSENSSSNRKSRREDALRRFLARIRSATDGSHAARYLTTPEVALFLARVIRRAIAELRGMSDDAADDDNGNDLDDECYQSIILGAETTTSTPRVLPPATAAAAPARKPDESLVDLGVDSLVMVELRTWLRQKLGASLSVAEIRQAGGGGVHALAATVARKLAASVA